MEGVDTGLLDCVGAWIVIVDDARRVRFANEAWVRVMGAGRTLDACLASSTDRGRLAAALDEAVAAGRANVDATLRTEGGEEQRACWTVRRLGDENLMLTAVPRTESERDACFFPPADAPDLLADIVRSSADAIVAVDIDGIIRAWNPAAERIYGYTADEMIGSTGERLYPQALREQRSRLLEVIEQGTPVELETVRVRRDGTELPVWLSVWPIRDRTGKVVGAGSIIRDLRERNALRARIERERRWLSQVIEAAPVGIVLTDTNHRPRANRAANEILGELIATPERLPQEISVCERDAQAPRELRIHRPDGSVVDVLSSASPVSDGEGTRLGTVSILTDVTRLKQLQRDRESMASMLERLVDVLPVGVWVTDTDGKVLRTNEMARTIWEGEATASEMGRIFTSDGRTAIAHDDWALHRALTRGETVRGEVLRIHTLRGSDKTVLVAATPLTDGARVVSGAVLVANDVTALRTIEEELRRAVQVRDEVLGIVAHDIRSPLNSVSLNAQLLLAGPLDDSSREAVRAILSSVRKIDALIQDLLEIRRIESGTLSLHKMALDVPALVRRVVAEHLPQYDRASVHLVSKCAERLPVVFADALRLSQVLSNLLSNAMKFTPPGGTVTIAAAPDELGVRFDVEDSGPGVPESHRDRVFDPFWQAQRGDRRGVGMGLAICRGIVEAHGGRIWVDGAPSGGAHFCFTLPLRA